MAPTIAPLMLGLTSISVFVPPSGVGLCTMIAEPTVSLAF